jgi:type IV pilus assembly protein PilA
VKTKNQIGFSLVELLVCVSIILLLLAFAIPNYLRAKMIANESSAVASITAINVANSMYALSCPTMGYAASLTALGPGNGTCAALNVLPDTALATTSPQRSGFNFFYAAGNAPATTYTISASPITPGVTGVRGFFSDQSEVIRWDPSGTANSSDPPLQ